jgi:preprotein translocase subunit SecY
MMSGGMSFLPLRVNSAGVIPIIFALAIVMIPGSFQRFIPETHFLRQVVDFIVKVLTPGSRMTGGSGWGLLVYAGLVVGFTYFYTSVTMNIQDMADNLKKWGNSIPGIRPGRPTMEYLDRVMSRITLAGAVFLAIVAALQYLVPEWTKVTTFRGIVGGTSLLIVVGVALETMKQIEAHLLMRHYEGFIK